MFKHLLLRNHMKDEAETWHTCLEHYPVQKLEGFFSRSDENSGCYGNLYFHRLIMGKVDIDNFRQVIENTCFLTEILIE